MRKKIKLGQEYFDYIYDGDTLTLDNEFTDNEFISDADENYDYVSNYTLDLENYIDLSDMLENIRDNL